MQGVVAPLERVDFTWALGTALLVLIVFFPALGCDFVNFDDRTFVVNNPHVNRGLTLEAVRWAFEIHGPSQYHPLAWLSHALDCEIYELQPRGHHFTSVLLHALSAGLVVLWLRMATGMLVPSVVAAMLFALHPLRVESVVWVAERKDVLCVFFGMLTLIAHAWHARQPVAGRYGLIVCAFALCLLSKPMLVTLPVVMLLLDVWPLGRAATTTWGRLIAEKLPLLAMSAIAGVLTLLAQRDAGTIEDAATSPLTIRAMNATVAAVWYLWKSVWPSGLAVFYPFRADWPAGLVAVCGALLAVITALVWWRRRRQPWLLVGWAWCVISVLPAIGLIQVGSQGMADRYSYFPSLGLTVALAWAGVHISSRRPALTRPLLLTAGVAVAVLVGVTIRQTGYWKNSVTLFTRALEVTTPNPLVHQNLGMALSEAGRLDDAISHVQKAVELKGDFARARANLGALLLQKGRASDAIEQLNAALKIDGRRIEAHVSLGDAMSQLKQWEAAVGHYRQYLDTQPRDAAAAGVLNNLAVAESNLGDWSNAEAHWREAIALNSEHASAYHNLGTRLRARGDLAGATQCFIHVVELRPNLATAHNTLGTLLASQGKLHEAAAAFQRAVDLQPDFADAKANLARATEMLGQPPPPPP